MATAPQSRKLQLTRDQLAAFLTDQQQIRQFELLFSVVDETQEIIGIDFLYQAGNAAATANEALAQISSLAQNTAVDDAVLNAKVQQALDSIQRLTQVLELIALAPVRNNVELEHDVNGILPVLFGGTGQKSYTDGQLLIGNTTGNTLAKSTLTAGAGISITNGPGSIQIESAVAALTAGANISITGTTNITIAVTGLGTMAFENIGATGSFTTADIPPQTVTVVNGIITSIV